LRRGVKRIPVHWTEKPLKHIVSINSDKLPDSTDPDFEIEYVDIGNVTLTDGITATEKLRFEAAPSRARRRVRHGDTIVSTVRTYLKAVAHIIDPPANLVVSTGFAVLRANPAFSPEYLYRLAQSEPFVHAIVAHSIGVSYPAINASDIGRFYIAIPPTNEQQVIAAFLDRETARIDNLIAKKQQLIALLSEEKATLISRVVTCGMDGNARTKDSGIPWLGRVPTHWQIVRLKRVLASTDYGVSESLNETGEVAVLRMGNLQDGALIFNELRYIDSVDSALLLRANDILFNRTNSLALIGKTALFTGLDTDKVSFASYLVRFRTNGTMDPAYLCLLLNRPETLERARALALPAIGQANLNPNRYGYIHICVPPLSEQQSIVEHVKQESARINGIVQYVTNAIDRLREYRSALIAAAVTGQIDVRNHRSEVPCQ
jgi:type I restriction enzyme S subunit